VAVAAHGTEYLLTWNCRHIHNLKLERRIESAHGIAGVIKRALTMRPDQLIANLSGRGDKDVAQAAEFLIEGKKP
jgi:tryptophan synthase beta subunit